MNLSICAFVLGTALASLQARFQAPQVDAAAARPVPTAGAERGGVGYETTVLCPATANSTGGPAWIGVGPPTADDFILTVDGVPTGSLGNFFAGPSIGASTVFGNALCLVGEIKKCWPVGVADASNHVQVSVDKTRSTLVVGTSYYFQFQFTDAAGSNTSNAISLLIQ